MGCTRNREERKRERGSKSVRTKDIALFIRKTHVDDVDEVVLTHIRAQSMSIAACVTPLLFLFKAFTVFTPSFSLNLGNSKKKNFTFLTKNNLTLKSLTWFPDSFGRNKRMMFHMFSMSVKIIYFPGFVGRVGKPAFWPQVRNMLLLLTGEKVKQNVSCILT